MVNVKIRIKGLGICCFNDIQERAEVAFLRCDGHDFTINVSENGTPIATFTPDSEKLIEVKSESPIINGFQINNDGGFDRGNPAANDSKDFRWVLDLEGAELHDKELPGKLPRMPLSPMYIYNASFGTANTTSFDLHLIKLINGKPEYRLKKLGKVGDEVEAIIEAKSATLAIEGEAPVPFEIDGVNYEIVVDNRCDHPNGVSSDFLLYYDVLNDPDGIQFALAKEMSDVEILSPPLVCNPSGRGKTKTITDLFP